MLAGMFKLTQRIEDTAGAVPPNTAVGEERLLLVVRLKQCWAQMMDASAVGWWRHPNLGRVPVIQPLLANAVSPRGLGSKEGQGDVDELLQHMLTQRATRIGTLSSVGASALHLAVADYIHQIIMLGGGESAAATTSACLGTLQALLAAGADAHATCSCFSGGGNNSSSSSTGGSRGGSKAAVQDSNFIYLNRASRVVVVMALSEARPFTALDICLRGPSYGQVLGGCASLAPEVSEQVQRVAGALRDATAAAPAAAPSAAGTEPATVASGAGGDALAAADAATAAAPPVPWSMAVFNILWAISLVMRQPGARSRRAALAELCATAPFPLPPMSFVTVQQLRQLGAIPRFATDGSAAASGPAAKLGSSSSRFQPLPTAALPGDAVCVFVSHRWLGNGCPDDDSGTKLQQVLAIADQLAARRGCALDRIYLWLDYSVVAQNDPMPGVQALPIYIACCDEFVYVHHEQYWERAWCLTEQFMQWKLCGHEVKYCLKPQAAAAAAGGGGAHHEASSGEQQQQQQRWALHAESGTARPPDPALGKLAVESDRIALATMTAILPFEDEAG